MSSEYDAFIIEVQPQLSQLPESQQLQAISLAGDLAIKAAMARGSDAALGDGTFMQFFMQIFQMLLPLIIKLLSGLG